MMVPFHLDYWHDDGWLIGQLREHPGVVSQGQTLAELELNIRDAFSLMTGEPVAALECLTLSPIADPPT